MKISAKTVWLVILKTIVFTIIVSYVSHTNMIVFNNRRIAGVPDGHVRVVLPEPSYFDLLFSQYGTLYFNHFGDSVRVHVAHYMRDEQVLHDSIVSIDFGLESMVSGSMRWGATAGNNLPSEILVSLTASLDTGEPEVGIAGFGSQNSFDFSQIDFESRMFTGPLFESGSIESGKRYILALWNTSGRLWVDGNMLEPYRLREGEHTAVLYIVFD